MPSGGDKIGKYEVKKLSRYREKETGEFGTVYVAEDPQGRRVTLKALSPEMARREARPLEIEHPNVATVKEVISQDSGYSYMVFECEYDATLAWMIRKGRNLPQQAVIRLAIEICQGLQEIHTNGFLYGDIKSYDILLTRTEPQVGEVWARIPGMGITSDDKARDESSEMESLGLILHELLTGQPFDNLYPRRALGGLSRSLQDVLLKALRHGQTFDGLRPRQVPGSLFSSLQDVLLKALGRGKQYQSVEDMRQALLAAKTGQPEGEKRGWRSFLRNFLSEVVVELLAPILAAVLVSLFALLFGPDLLKKLAPGPQATPTVPRIASPTLPAATSTPILTPTVTNTPIPTLPPGANQPPSVKIMPARDKVPPGSSVILTAVANDPEDDELTYEWTADRGQIPTEPRSESYVIYSAPNTPGDATVRVVVRDGYNEVEETIVVKIQ